MGEKQIRGSVQSKITAKGKEYLYTVIFIPRLGKTKWEATGLEAKGNIKRAERILNERISEYMRQEREFQEQSEAPKKSGDSINFLDWVVDFVEYTKSTVRGSTGEGYQYRLKHVVEYFGDKNIKLSEVTALDIDDFVNYLLVAGKTNQKTGEKSGLAIRTVRSIKTIIVSALNKAVLLGYVEGNVALSVAVGKKSNSSMARKMNFMTLDELNDFLKYVNEIGDDMADIIKVIAYYGLRRSEALGLYLGKDSVDLEGRRLHITRTIVKVEKIHDEDNVKSQDSMREFYITDEMAEFFKKVIKKKEENRAFYGNTYHENSKSLFSWEDGKEFSPDYLEHHFSKIMKKYGRPTFSLHNLRHSSASLLIALGWSETEVMEWLGHSNYATTHKWYIVISQAYKKKKAESLDGKLNIL